MINKEQVICKISSEKIIAIARGIYGEQCINLAKALYDGGISLLEITYDQSSRNGRYNSSLEFCSG